MLSEQLFQAFLQPESVQKLATARLFLACSGGRDSLALAYACWQLYQQGVIQHLPILLHIHHGWQDANDDWARLVKSWADQHGFECRVLTVCLDKKTETDARDKRYQALMSQMNDGDVLMLAHHANDQVETLLMRLADGAGLSGLSAMKTWQGKRNAQKCIWLWRPLLSISRDEISQFAKTHNLPFVDDPSNLSQTTARGLIRTQILPALMKLNPSAVANMARSASLLAQSWQIVDGVVEQAVQSVTQCQNAWCTQLKIEQFFQLPMHLRQSVLHAWLQGDAPLPPAYQLTQAVLSLLNRTHNDHQTVLFWQNDGVAFYICRYDDVLYRFHQAYWQSLHAISSQANWVAGEPFCVTMGDFLLQWRCDIGQVSSVQKIEQNQAVQIGKHRYRAKKLYQKIRLPVWLRPHLWLVFVNQNGQTVPYLLAPLFAWNVLTEQFEPKLAVAWQFCTKHDNQVQ